MASFILAGAVEKAVEKTAEGIGKVYNDTTNFAANAFTGLPETVGNTVEYIENGPSIIADHIDEVSKSVSVLAAPEVQENIQNIMSKSGEIVSNSIAENGDELKGAVINGAKDVTETVGEATLASLKAIPVLGLGVAAGEGTVKTAIALVNASNKLGETAAKIIKGVTAKLDTINPSPLVNPHPQNGGAKKTRKHMKKVIRDRVLIQSRTNKMIHEFLNPNHTIKRVKTIKIIKTKRRRNK